MGRLFASDKDLYVHLTIEDIKKLIVTRVKGGGRNYYAVYDLIHGNNISIPEKLAMEVLDEIKKGKICDVWHSFNWDEMANF